jgi:hypothetical protein
MCKKIVNSNNGSTIIPVLSFVVPVPVGDVLSCMLMLILFCFITLLKNTAIEQHDTEPLGKFSISLRGCSCTVRSTGYGSSWKILPV